MTIWLRFVSLVEAGLSFAGLVLLLTIRPAWPPLPASLSSPLTTLIVEQVVLVVLWLSTALLLLLVSVGSIAAVCARSSPLPLSPRLAGIGRGRRRAADSGPAFSPPFPLLVRGPSERGDTEYDDRPREADRPPAPGVRVAILGPLEITTTWQRDRALRALTQEIVVYLSFHRVGATTDELADALLPRLAADRARNRIWRALSEARSELHVIRRTGDRYVLERTAVTIDVDEFDSLIAQSKAERGATLQRLLEGALARVRGDPLTGADYVWAAGEVRHMRARIVDALHDLGEVRLAAGDAAGALAAAERALEFDADDESAHRLAMRAESALGLRDAIADRYERLSGTLDTRYGLEPEQQTRLLYRRLLSQDAKESAAGVRRRMRVGSS